MSVRNTKITIIATGEVINFNKTNIMKMDDIHTPDNILAAVITHCQVATCRDVSGGSAHIASRPQLCF